MKILVKTIKEFNKEFINLVTEKGFVLNKDNRYEYDSPQYGKYICHADPTKNLLTIFGFFDNPEKANPILIDWGGNKYSGKMNFHEMNMGIIYLFKNFINQL